MREPPSPPVSFALVGCGVVGRKRADALRRLPGVTLRYACDRDPQRAEEVARGFPGCEAASSLDPVLQDSSVAAVVVATLNASLAPIALAAIRAGKHVLLEKPGALSSSQLRTLREAAQTHGCAVRIGYNHRYHPALQKARDLVSSGALGPLMFLRGRYGHGGRVGYDREWRADPRQSGGGELIDQGVHLIDLAAWFLGEFTQVEGFANTYFWDMAVDDNAFVSLRTAAGQAAWLHVSCTEWKNLFSLEIYGRDGKLAIDGLGGSYGVERLTHYRMLPEMGPPETTAWEYPRSDGSWGDELAAFVQDVRTGRPPDPGLSEGIRVLDIVEAVYRRSGFPVADAPVTVAPEIAGTATPRR